MLILARKKEESIMIGDNIEIKILEIQKGVARIGIDAPKELGVHRKEIYLAIQENPEGRSFRK